jgi:predicted nucleic acid-binding protein
MALRFLLETSVIKRLGRVEVRAVVEPLATAGEISRPIICDLEVGYSARNAEEWDRPVGALDAFEPVETSAAHVRRALQVQRLLVQRSQHGRKIPDLLIAAAAEELDVAVLHYDADGSCPQAAWSKPDIPGSEYPWPTGFEVATGWICPVRLVGEGHTHAASDQAGGTGRARLAKPSMSGRTSSGSWVSAQ